MDGLAEFSYLKPIANKYADLYFAKDIRNFVDQISEDDLAELSRSYEEIDKRQHAYQLSRWYDRCMYGKAVAIEELQLAQAIGRLFILFDHFAEKAIPPFASCSVNYIERFEKPNWQNFPSELHYLIEVIEKYVVASEVNMIDMVDSLSETEMNELAMVAEKVKRNGHYSVLIQWLQSFPLNEPQPREAALAYSFFGLMDLAGLEFD